jgi:hypothetical protein
LSGSADIILFFSGIFQKKRFPGMAQERDRKGRSGNCKAEVEKIKIFC